METRQRPANSLRSSVGCWDGIICFHMLGCNSAHSSPCHRGQLGVGMGQRGESSLGISGRIRSPEMKSLLAKQLGMGLASLEGAGQLDLKTGRLTRKKQKRKKPRSNWLWMSLKSCLTSSLYQDYTMSEMFSFGIFINFTFSPLLCPAEVEESCQWDPEVLGRDQGIWGAKFWWIGTWAPLLVISVQAPKTSIYSPKIKRCYYMILWPLPCSPR